MSYVLMSKKTITKRQIIQPDSDVKMGTDEMSKVVVLGGCRAVGSVVSKTPAAESRIYGAKSSPT